ncbi:hypothetical protein ACLOJK_029456 [Asimina triloba]
MSLWGAWPFAAAGVGRCAARGFCLQGMNDDGFSAGRCLGCLRWMKMGLGHCWSVEDGCYRRRMGGLALLLTD